MSWYVLYTAARAEKQVVLRLIKEGIECFLPIHKSKRRWSDRIKIVEMPLFSSYVFVKCPEHKLRDLVNIYGISRIVYYLQKPAVVRDIEIEAIKEFLDIADSNELITKGDEVEIICGSFEKITGKVLMISDKAAVLYLEELGAKVCVKRDNINKLPKK